MPNTEAQNRYQKAKTKIYGVKVIKDTTEKDIFDKLESVENVSGYIKALIRADIAAEK